MHIISKHYQKILIQRVGEVLHYMWDPIGVAGTPEARDEYDSYVTSIYGLLNHQRIEGEIAKRLTEIETKDMGMILTEEVLEQNKEIENVLVSWRDVISALEKDNPEEA